MSTTAGSLSVSLLFVFIGLMELDLSETMVIGCAATLVQCFLRLARRPQAIQVIFNVANTAAAIKAAHLVYQSQLLASRGIDKPVLILLATGIFFLVTHCRWPP